jgi:hypothetical protein
MKRNLLTLAALTIIGLGFVACDRETQPPLENKPPNTTIANVPVDSSLQRAVITVYWDGEDEDGFVQNYQYRVVSKLEPTGLIDTTEWTDTIATQVTIPVRSDDSSNFQIFQVRAIDDKGAVDPTPAEKELFTYTTSFPATTILYPTDGQQLLIDNEITDWFLGINLNFEGVDIDGEILQYGYAVDGGDTTWTKDTSVVIDPSMFQGDLTGEHQITVTCMDDTYLIDTVGATITINLIYPSFSKKALIIDATDESLWTLQYRWQPTDEEVDSFYTLVFPGCDQWDMKENNFEFPAMEVVGDYRAIIWHADHFPNTSPHPIVQYADQLRNYMYVGGNFIIGGHRILKSFNWEGSVPVEYSDTSFVYRLLHIQQSDESHGAIGDFKEGVIPFGNENMVYQAFELDDEKTLTAGGGLPAIGIISRQGGFTEPIYAYMNAPNSPFTSWRRQPIALRYYGTEFQAAILGFPIWYLKTDDAIALGEALFTDLEIN